MWSVVRRRDFVFVVFALVMSLPVTTSGLQWDVCADALDRLRQLSRDLSDQATAVADAEREVGYQRTEVESRQRELEDCARLPDVFGLLDDGCTGRRQTYESALSDYENAVLRLDGAASGFANEFETLNRQWSSAWSACQAGPLGSPGVSFCDLLRGYLGSVPREDLMDVCRESRSETECQSCLGPVR